MCFPISRSWIRGRSAFFFEGHVVWWTHSFELGDGNLRERRLRDKRGRIRGVLFDSRPISVSHSSSQKAYTRTCFGTFASNAQLNKLILWL